MGWRADTRVQLLAALVAALCVAVSGLLSAAAGALAGRAQLVYTDVAEEGERPEVALGVAMGAFRGLFVNMLWLRAENMKRQGKFHEAVALREAITRLQPHFPMVWVFQAWDMAYNISVEAPTAQERWQWVKRGIDLLRKEGIPRNPNSTWLHRELAWIFVHKMQGRTDEAHAYYKRQHAREWTIVMGPPVAAPRVGDADVQRHWERLQAEWPARREQLLQSVDPARVVLEEPTMRDALREADIERKVRRLQYINDAPDTMEELVKREPLVQELVDRLRKEAGVEPGYRLLELFEMQRALEMTRLEYASTEGVSLAFNLRDEERNLAFERLLREEEQLQPAWRALLPYLRKQLIVNEYHMELPRMIRYTKRFGPLDWRVPAAHAVYWASRGVEEGLGRVNSEDFDRVNTDRLVLHGLQECFRFGELFYNMLDDTYVALPNLNFIDSYTRALDVLREREDERFEGTHRAYSLYTTGYHNFLRDVIRILYRRGETGEAERYFQYLRQTTIRNTSDTLLQLMEQSKTLEEFVALDLDERIVSADFALTEIIAALHGAWVQGLLRGDRERFDAAIEYANKVHKKYMEYQNVTTTADPNVNRMGSAIMPPRFIDVVVNAFVDFLLSGEVGQVEAHLIWERAPRGLRQAAYDTLAQLLKPREPAFDQLFPEPQGMEEYRQLRAQLDQQDPDLDKQLLQFAPK